MNMNWVENTLSQLTKNKNATDKDVNGTLLKLENTAVTTKLVP